jgi:hypothetical protein
MSMQVVGTRREWADGWPSALTMFGIASGLALAAVLFGWRGSDLPAQVFRSELVRDDGFVVWNSQWFGGHPVLTYSVLSPILGALTGPIALGAISGILSAVLFERILRFAYGHTAWIGAFWFAMGTVTNLIVGRVTFALGVMFGLVAVYALQRRHPVATVVAALLCTLASPLAGVFLVVVAAAWVCADRERRPAAIGMFAGALLPLAALAVLFPGPGREPYEYYHLIWDLCLCLCLVYASRWAPALRWGALFYAAALAAAFVVPSAVGGNMSRLGMYVGGPLLACALLPRRRLLLVALAIPLLVWQWYPTIDGIAYAHGDPSTKRAYYRPLVDFLSRQTGPIGRVEIPSTFRHWEAAYAAPHVPLARGWERQLDIAYAPIFYGEPLTPETFHDWLTANGVRFVALPDAQLDDSSLGERDLLERGLPYLEPVWHDAHWRVWRVAGFAGLASGGAELLSLSSDGFTLDVPPNAGDIVVRVRPTRLWSVPGPACASATDDDWTVLRGLPAGVVEVSQSLGATPCHDS